MFASCLRAKAHVISSGFLRHFSTDCFIVRHSVEIRSCEEKMPCIRYFQGGHTVILLIFYLASISIKTSSAFIPSPNSIARYKSRHVCISHSSAIKQTSGRINKALESTVGCMLSPEAGGKLATLGLDSYWLTRIAFLRALGLVCFTAFLVAYRQNKALIGDNGISPARIRLEKAEKRGVIIRERERDRMENFGKKNYSKPVSIILSFLFTFPFVDFDRVAGSVYKWWTNRDGMDRPLTTVLWLARDRSHLNGWLDGIALSGLAMSLFLLIQGAGNVPLLFGLWICQHSLMAIGGPFYGYGWEPQLAELVFHSLFLVPLCSISRIPAHFPTPKIVVWTIRWHLFRIMIGAGLIKFRSSDKKWGLKHLTTMNFFYETQPVPNVLTRTFHRMPETWHKFEVLVNHFVEVIAPWLFIVPFLPRSWRIFGGLLQINFQSVLILSGNLSFLNWLTIVPSIMCLDDAFLAKFFGSSVAASASIAAYTEITARQLTAAGMFRQVIPIMFGVLVAKLSIPVVKNLSSSKQIMNGSFDPLRLINTYGAFGTVSEERIELIIESAESIYGPWKEYNFNVKPGDVMKRPKWITPYHHRLDWQMWISQFSRQPPAWMYNFLLKLLLRDPGVIRLLDDQNGDPWALSKEKIESHVNTTQGAGEKSSFGQPKYIRVERYKYKFYKPHVNSREGGKEPFWVRERLGRFFPLQGVVGVDDLQAIVSRG